MNTAFFSTLLLGQPCFHQACPFTIGLVQAGFIEEVPGTLRALRGLQAQFARQVVVARHQGRAA